MSICGIYAIINIIGGKIYIGQSVDIRQRFGQHKYSLKNNKHGNPYLQNSWNKHGPENFIFKIIEKCSENELDDKEIFYLDQYNKNTDLYNMKDGGSRAKFAEETKKKISESAKGNTYGKGNKGNICSEKTKQKIRNTLLGQPAWNKGIPNSKEKREKISIANKGRIAPNKGIPMSDEQKIKLSESCRGEKHYLFGKHRSEETRQKIRDSWIIRKLKKENNIS